MLDVWLGLNTPLNSFVLDKIRRNVTCGNSFFKVTGSNALISNKQYSTPEKALF